MTRIYIGHYSDDSYRHCADSSNSTLDAVQRLECHERPGVFLDGFRRCQLPQGEFDQTRLSQLFHHQAPGTHGLQQVDA